MYTEEMRMYTEEMRMYTEGDENVHFIYDILMIINLDRFNDNHSQK